MKFVLQRVSQAKVEVDGKNVGSIEAGVLVFVSFGPKDNQETINKSVEKIKNLAVFADQAGKINLSLLDTRQSILVVSQFTLHADLKKGKRPSFGRAAPAPKAEKLYNYFIDRLIKAGLKVETGQFGANMQVSLTNDGPVTYILNLEEDE